ncbi:VRR-NUC domain-containing protein [Candidatus Borrarchaeum sp.]|uniref:VRR-NUC domain-containing protein n=1 Tax=Candidatus Borrarchaeum sp. TaxID=2846742 RepID=UPI00257D3B6D|nr:VRR-NUC domain-containing protein [Candidatus Borrarchaeum sp.]
MNELEKKFKEEAKRRGCEVLRGGYPDFLVIPPEGDPFFVEVKKDGTYLTKKQHKMIRTFSQLGLSVFISFNGEWACMANPSDYYRKSMQKKKFRITP